jgi:hypothetical protein
MLTTDREAEARRRRVDMRVKDRLERIDREVRMRRIRAACDELMTKRREGRRAEERLTVLSRETRWLSAKRTGTVTLNLYRERQRAVVERHAIVLPKWATAVDRWRRHVEVLLRAHQITAEWSVRPVGLTAIERAIEVQGLTRIGGH